MPTRINNRAASMHIFGEWPSSARGRGFPTRKKSPCFGFAVPRDSLHGAASANVLSLPHALNQVIDYHIACDRVARARNTHAAFKTCVLCCDRTSKALLLNLVTPFPELKLKAGDRLQLFPDLPVGACFSFRSSNLKGCRCFSAKSRTTISLPKCPLFNSDTRLTHNETEAFDLLHTD